jgi:uncharacterized membrane protein YbaN (DUF454 family)
VINENNEARQMPFIYKIFLMAIVAICVVIGLVGLVLPIIPGIVFLALAAFIFAKVSTRFNFILRGHSKFRKMKQFRRSLTALSVPQRVRLSFWMVARTVVNTVESAVNFVTKKSGPPAV